MLVMRTTKDPADSIGKLVSSQQPIGLNHFSLAVDPLGLYGIQPRTLLGQQTAYDPHSLSALFDLAVMFSQPAPDLPGDVPTGVVPDEEQQFPAESFELLDAPF